MNKLRPIIFVTLLLTSSALSANYCIQVVSAKNTLKKSLIKQSNQKVFQNMPDVRVEEYGRFLVLRVGDYTSKVEATKSLRQVRKVFGAAYVRECSRYNKTIVYVPSNISEATVLDTKKVVTQNKVIKNKYYFGPPKNHTNFIPDSYRDYLPPAYN